MAPRYGQLQELQGSAEHDGRSTHNGHPQFVPQTEDNSRDKKKQRVFHVMRSAGNDPQGRGYNGHYYDRYE
jgi:hypothetical protein